MGSPSAVHRMSAARGAAGWDNFYVIIGSAAAGLTGLTFVVIALSADANMARCRGSRPSCPPRSFISARRCGSRRCAVCRGTRARVSGSRCSRAAPSAPPIRMGTMYRMAPHGRSDYVPVLEDWIWNGALPLASYAALGVGGALIWHESLARGTISSVSPRCCWLLIGIHNVWDLAVWILAERPQSRREMEGRPAATPRAAPERRATRGTGGVAIGRGR